MKGKEGQVEWEKEREKQALSYNKSRVLSPKQENNWMLETNQEKYISQAVSPVKYSVSVLGSEIGRNVKDLKLDKIDSKSRKIFSSMGSP